MYCQNCGKIISKDSSFCVHCGKSVETKTKTVTSIWPASKSSESSVQANDTSLSNTILLQKDFVGRAFLSWLLYYIGFYIIGLIVNIMYLSQANKIKQASGTSPSGRGCLQILLFLHFWFPLAIILILVIGGAFGFAYFEDILDGIRFW